MVAIQYKSYGQICCMHPLLEDRVQHRLASLKLELDFLTMASLRRKERGWVMDFSGEGNKMQ